MAPRPTPYRDLDDAGLLQALVDTKEALFNLRFQNATGQLDNHASIGEPAATWLASTPSSEPARSRPPKRSRPRGRTPDGRRDHHHSAQRPQAA